MPVDAARQRALRFRCRRGNAETEALLMAFVETLSGSDSHSRLFECLLDESDHFLMQWLLTPTPAPAPYAELVAAIRAHYHTL